MYPPSWPKSLLHAASHSVIHTPVHLTSGQKGQMVVGEKGKQ